MKNSLMIAGACKDKLASWQLALNGFASAILLIDSLKAHG